MVEPVSLTLGALVSAMVYKAAEASSEAAVSSVTSAGKGLAQRLKGVFKSDDQATKALERVEDPPVQARHLEALAAAVDEAAPVGSELYSQLSALLDEAGDATVESVAFQVWGDHNITVAGNQNSTVNISITGDVAPHFGDSGGGSGR